MYSHLNAIGEGILRSLLAAALILPPGFIFAGAQNSTPDAPKPIAQVDYRPAGKLIYVLTTVNGSEPLWFILDSGAPNTLIDSASARRLNVGRRLTGRSRGQAEAR